MLSRLFKQGTMYQMFTGKYKTFITNYSVVYRNEVQIKLFKNCPVFKILGIHFLSKREKPHNFYEISAAQMFTRRKVLQKSDLHFSKTWTSPNSPSKMTFDLRIPAACDLIVVYQRWLLIGCAWMTWHL